MTARIEWRSNGGGEDSLLFVSEYGESENTALKTWEADADRLTDFLNEMTTLDTSFTGLETDVNHRDPEQYGKMVLARSREGDILEIDPELYWDGIYKWFRVNGTDPHRMRDKPN